MLIGENAHRSAARTRTLAEHLASIAAGDHAGPALVRMLVFSGRHGLLASIQPRTAGDCGCGEGVHELPAHLGERSPGNSLSQDRELFMAPYLSDIVTAHVHLMRQEARTDPVAARDELRVELIGPRGTCSNCADALRKLTAAYQRVIDRTLGPEVLELTVMTRWTSQPAG